jgi:hypothetical protein
VILDGFISATLDTDALAALHVPSVAMVHHPLALETGLDPARRDAPLPDRARNLAHVDHVLVPSPATAAMLTGRYGVAPGAHHHRPARHRPPARRARPHAAADPVGGHPAPAQGARHPAARWRADRSGLDGGDRGQGL